MGAPRRFSWRWGLALAALGAAGIAAACGFEGAGTYEASDSGRGASDGAVDATVPDDADTLLLLDSAFDDPDADAPVEAGADGACPTNSFKCETRDGGCFTGCGTCGRTQLACVSTGTCLARCAGQCPGSAFECFACSGGGMGKLSKTTCEADAAACNTGDAGYCDCKGKKGCFGPFQVCVATERGRDECRGCGDTSTDAGTCVGGILHCTAATSICE